MDTENGLVWKVRNKTDGHIFWTPEPPEGDDFLRRMTVKSPEKFCLFFLAFQKLEDGSALARVGYVNECVSHRIPPRSDDEILNSYSVKFFDWFSAEMHIDNDHINSVVDLILSKLRLKKLEETKELVCANNNLDSDSVLCACGHIVKKINRMSASFGSACADCYDALSE